jgi:hypothetical protein
MTQGRDRGLRWHSFAKYDSETNAINEMGNNFYLWCKKTVPRPAEQWFLRFKASLIRLWMSSRSKKLGVNKLQRYEVIINADNKQGLNRQVVRSSSRIIPLSLNYPIVQFWLFNHSWRYHSKKQSMNSTLKSTTTCSENYESFQKVQKHSQPSWILLLSERHMLSLATLSGNSYIENLCWQKISIIYKTCTN